MNTGRIKFFGRSRLLSADGADAVATSGGNSVSNLLSFDRGGYWQSGDATDGRESIINFILGPVREVSRLLIVDTNCKDIAIRFNAPLENIIDIDNLRVQSVAPYRNGNPVVYLEFDPIPATSLQLTVSNTLTPNERKYIRQVIVASEIGVFEGYPTVRGYNENHNAITHRASTGIKHIIKQIRTIDQFNIQFRHYPVGKDIELSDQLFAWPEDSFTLWPCGGGYGSDHFLFDAEGWRLQDIYNVQTAGNKGRRWWRNFYKSGIQTELRLVEVI